MRRHVDRAKLERFMMHIGRRASTPGTVFITGGSSALILGIRDQTIDVDIKLDPEPGGVFEAIAERDLADVRAMSQLEFINSSELSRLSEAILPYFIRYPAIDPSAFKRKVQAFLRTDAENRKG